eukprot:COSAG02_NODE_31546_length_531_cov_1.625000_1_plen_45_part_10
MLSRSGRPCVRSRPACVRAVRVRRVVTAPVSYARVIWVVQLQATR